MVEPVDAEFEQYEVLIFEQVGGETSTNGGDIAITVTLVPDAA